MRCIYCKEPTTGDEGEAHIFPEAIIQNDYTLLKGTICDKCNNYFSSLESVLILHNHIGPLIQIFGLKGKKGKAREKIGYFERKGTSIHIDFKEKDISTVNMDRNRILVNVKNKAQFDDLKFRRALYCIAFNFLAYNISNEEILSSQFDNVRKYIRAPKPNEKCPYCQNMHKPPTPILGAMISPSSPGTLLICVKIFHNEFYMDLLQPETLHERLRKEFGGKILYH